MKEENFITFIIPPLLVSLHIIKKTIQAEIF